jgi:hypothetical protein
MPFRNNHAEEKPELATLRRIEALVTVIAKAALAQPLAEILADKKLRLIFEGAGRISRPELERKTEFSGGKISGLWKQWESKGLMVKDGRSYRSIFRG